MAGSSYSLLVNRTNSNGARDPSTTVLHTEPSCTSYMLCHRQRLPVLMRIISTCVLIA